MQEMSAEEKLAIRNKMSSELTRAISALEIAMQYGYQLEVPLTGIWMAQASIKMAQERLDKELSL